MDKFELEGQILRVLDTDDWMTVKEVHARIHEVFGSEPPESTVRSRLESLVRFRAVESRTQTVGGWKNASYRRLGA